MTGQQKNAFWRFGTLGGIFVAIVTGLFLMNPIRGLTAMPGRLLVIYATASATGGETLWVAPYSAQGHETGSPIRLGRLGLVAQSQIATFDQNRHILLITLGSTVRAVVGSGSQLFASVPKPWVVLSIHWMQGNLYAVAERPGQSHASLWKFKGRNWKVVDNRLPSGIVTLTEGPLGLPTVFVADPHHAYTLVVGSSRSGQYPEFIGAAPQGTVAFYKTAELVPYADGSQGFGQWIGYPNRGLGIKRPFANAGQAVIEVVHGERLWGIGAFGMIPYRGIHPLVKEIHRWPMVMQTTLVPVGSGDPWLVVLDGPSQGIWFNTQTGQFGPRFQIILPSGDIARAVVVRG